MPSKYVPPHLRNKNGSVNQNRANSSQNQNTGNTGSGNQRSNFGNQRFNNFNQNQSNFQPNQRFNSNQGQGRFQSYSNQPPKVVSYVEKQKAKGIDPFKPVEKKEPQKSGRFASWDSRSSGRSTGGLTPLGFHGSVADDKAEEDRLYSQVKNTGINFDKYDAIPVEVSGEGAPGPLEAFDGEEAKKMLPERLLRNLELCKFKKPTPVQKHSIPIGLADRDLMACAQTGSGKTGGFLFPIISQLLRKGAMVVEGGSRNYRVSRPNAVVLGPTRELVAQIYQEAEKFCYGTGIRPVVVYGGADSRAQRNELRGGADLLVGTPGRLLDFLQRKDIELCCVQMLVLDEADRMLDMGFEPSIRRIVHELDMPKTDARRTFMFSATFPREIQRLAQDFMDDYIFLTVGRVGSAAKDITQTLQYVQEYEKRDNLVTVLNAIEGGLVLVFVQTKRNAENLQHFLYEQGFPTASIHGDRTQAEREFALECFRTGEAPILVATDVAARGLDIDNVTFVINYDLPGNIDDYVHRIGRTGRAGNKGTALSFFNEKNSNLAGKLLSMLQENNQQVPTWLKNYSGGGSGRSYGRNSHFGSQTRDFRRGNNSGGRRGGGSGGQSRRSGGSNSQNQPQQQRRFGGRQSNAASKSGVSDAW